MKQYEITGLGPMNTVTGLQKIFTHLPRAFEVNAAWLAAQPKAPEIGEFIEVDDKGAFALLTKIANEIKEYSDGTVVTGRAPLPDLSPDQQDAAQKKSAGTDESDGGSKPSPFKQFTAKLISASACEIAGVAETGEPHEYACSFADGSEKIANAEITQLHTPLVGDYWVIATFNGITREDIIAKEDFEMFFDPAYGK